MKKHWKWILFTALLVAIITSGLWLFLDKDKVKPPAPVVTTETVTTTLPGPVTTLPAVTTTLPVVTLPPVVKNHYIEEPGPTTTVTTPVAVVTYIDVPGPTTTLPPVTTTLPAVTITLPAVTSTVTTTVTPTKTGPCR